MAIPILLDSKLAFVYGEAGKVRFQAGDTDERSIGYYRLKSAAFGEILSQGVIGLTAEPGGASNIYSFSLTFANSMLFKGATVANLSVSLDNITWSPSIQLSLIYPPSLAINIIPNMQTADFNIKGQLSFEEVSETDFLDSYKITIKQGSVVKEESAWLNPYVYNIFDYQIKMIPEEGIDYTITVEYITDKGYSGIVTKNFTFNNLPSITEEHNIQFYAIDGALNELVNDVVCIRQWGIEAELDSARQVTVYLDRTSSESEYKKWMTIQSYALNPKEQNTSIRIALSAYDKYLDYGIGYKYRLRAIATIPVDGVKKQFQMKTEPSQVFTIIKDDILLEAPDLSYLTVRFNPTINSYKYNRKEAVTPTIGGVYPVVRRSGNQEYRSFTVGGLISSEGEFANNELLPSEININHLNGYNKELVKERIFREKVLNFLFRDEVLLYRSIIEGMMLVRLTNISLTPNTQLGRRLWSFTAQVTEVDECSSANLQKYNFKIPFDPSSEVQAYGDLVINNASVEDETLSINTISGNGTEVNPYYLTATLQWFDAKTGELIKEE